MTRFPVGSLRPPAAQCPECVDRTHARGRRPGPSSLHHPHKLAICLSGWSYARSILAPSTGADNTPPLVQSSATEALTGPREQRCGEEGRAPRSKPPYAWAAVPQGAIVPTDTKQWRLFYPSVLWVNGARAIVAIPPARKIVEWQGTPSITAMPYPRAGRSRRWQGRRPRLRSLSPKEFAAQFFFLANTLVFSIRSFS